MTLKMGYPKFKDKSDLKPNDLIMVEGFKDGQFLIQPIAEVTEDDLILLQNGLDVSIQGKVCVLGKKGDKISFIS